MSETFSRAGRPTGPGFFMMRWLRAAAAPLLVVLTAGGCRPAPAAIPLEPSFPTKEAAAEALLAALATRERPALEQLVLGETEFKKYVWPALEASTLMPMDYAWGDFRQKNTGYMATLLGDHGGIEYRLAGVTFAGKTSDYGAFRVHRETTLELRGPHGTESLRLFGSMIESGGRWKLYSFVAD